MFHGHISHRKHGVWCGPSLFGSSHPYILNTAFDIQDFVRKLELWYILLYQWTCWISGDTRRSLLENELWAITYSCNSFLVSRHLRFLPWLLVFKVLVLAAVLGATLSSERRDWCSELGGPTGDSQRFLRSQHRTANHLDDGQPALDERLWDMSGVWEGFFFFF